VLLAGMVGGMLIVLATVALSLRAPWLGIVISPSSPDDALVVSDVPENPAHTALHSGDEIVAVIDHAGRHIPVGGRTLISNAYQLPTWNDFDQYLQRLELVHEAFQGGPVRVELRDGRTAQLVATQSTPLSAVALTFWLMLGAAILVYVICIAVWAYRPDDVAAGALALCGFAALLLFCTIAIESYGTWPMAAGYVRQMYHLNVFSLSLAGFAFLALIWCYPSILKPVPVIRMAVVASLLSLLLDLQRWVPRPALTTLPAVVAYAGLTIPVGIAQWHRDRDNPLERAALKWLYLVLLLTAGFVAAANSAPIVVGSEPFVSNLTNALAAVALFGGIALGVARYRLFNLERWWFEAGMWVVGGVLVILFDAFLVWASGRRGIALATALALAGCCWFPLRQWLWQRLSRAASRSTQHWPQLVEALFSARDVDEMQERWQGSLEKIYSPLQVRVLPEETPVPIVRDDGLALRAPGLATRTTVELRLAGKGQRLFGRDDEVLAGNLLKIARQALHARRALDEHAQTERIRQREKELLVQDLHDGLGGTVTNIALLADMGARNSDADAARRALLAIAELAREGAADIRSFMTAVDEVDIADWHDVAADLRQCARGMLEPHAIELAFAVDVAPDAGAPDALLRINLLRAYKEMLNNVIKHASAHRVTTELHVVPPTVRLAVRDDGRGFSVSAPDAAGDGACRGLRHLRQRAAASGGSLSLDSAPGSGTRVTLVVGLPLRSPAPGMADTISHA
jgi:signal transduction histidine kinase